MRASFSPSGDALAIQFLDGAVELHPIAEAGEPRILVEGHASQELVGSSGGAPHPGLVWSEDGQAIAFALCRYPDHCLVGVLDGLDRAAGGRSHAMLPTGFVSTLAPTASADAVLVGRPAEPVVTVFEPASGESWSTRFADASVVGQAWVDGRVRVATQEAGGTSLSVWSWEPRSDQLHRLFDEADLAAILPSEAGSAVYLDAGAGSAMLWSIASTRFALIPPLPAGIETVTLSADGRTLLGRGWDERSGAGLAYVLDVATGQGRRLPRLVDPVALSGAGVVADYRVGEGVRVWEDPTPADAEGFDAWLDQATNVHVGVEALAPAP